MRRLARWDPDAATELVWEYSDMGLHRKLELGYTISHSVEKGWEMRITTEAAMGKVRLLVADDNPDLLNLLRDLLERVKGFQVFTAEDGPTALRRFAEVQPDLVILDVWMPGMSGIEVARRIRQESSVPILFLSAVGTPEAVTRGLEAGAEAYLTKPFSPRAFLSKVYELLRQ